MGYKWSGERKVHHSAKMKGRNTSSPLQKQRTFEVCAKLWDVVHPDGKVETIKSLRQFALSRGLSPIKLAHTRSSEESKDTGGYWVAKKYPNESRRDRGKNKPKPDVFANYFL